MLNMLLQDSGRKLQNTAERAAEKKKKKRKSEKGERAGLVCGQNPFDKVTRMLRRVS